MENATSIMPLSPGLDGTLLSQAVIQTFEKGGALMGPSQANLCLRAFRHDKFQLRMPSHSEGPGIWLSV